MPAQKEAVCLLSLSLRGLRAEVEVLLDYVVSRRERRKIEVLLAPPKGILRLLAASAQNLRKLAQAIAIPAQSWAEPPYTARICLDQPMRPAHVAPFNERSFMGRERLLAQLLRSPSPLSLKHLV
jgi:hypothetical protein